jgi:hypothetical protein
MRVWRWWVELWDRREPPTALALVRIFVGLCVLGDLLEVGRMGIVEALWAPPPEGMGHGASADPWAVQWLGASGETARLLWWIGVASSAALVVGLGTRVAAIVMMLVSAQLGMLAPDSDRGIDVALRVVALVLAFSHCHARWSVDAWIRRRIGRPFPELVAAWPRYLLFAQVVWIYFSGGHNKSEPEWYPVGRFAALANSLSDPHFARFSSDWVPMVWPLPAIATATTILFEWGAPFLLLFMWFETTAERPGRIRHWCNRWHARWIWIAIGVFFHIGIAMFLRLGIFPWGMLATYPVLLRSEELVRIEAWVRQRVYPRRS